MGGFSIMHLFLLVGVLVLLAGVPALVVIFVSGVIRGLRGAPSQQDEARLRKIVREEIAAHNAKRSEQSRPRT